jgi:hypothetical protein
MHISLNRYETVSTRSISNNSDHSGRSISHHLIWAAKSQINGQDLNTEEVCPVLISTVDPQING